MLCHLVFTRHEFERYGRIDCYDLVTALFMVSKISEPTRATFSFSPLAAMLERGELVLRMLDVEHIFYFFRNLGTAPLARRAETTS